MPYQVIIQSSGSATPILRTDLTADELRTRFLQPYAEGIPLVVDGSAICLQSLRQIKLYESEGPIALVIAAAQQSDDERSVAHLGDLRHRAVELSRDVTEQFITCPPGSGNRVTAPSMPEPPKNSVFLVHGRNHRVNQALRDFLRAVGLQVVEWTHAVAQTGIPLPMTSDIVDQGFAMSHASVVLLTPDDLVQIHPDLSSATEEKCPLGQPRPNVLFEAGMASS